MDSWVSTYSHKGVMYEHDRYTGQTYVLGSRPIVPSPIVIQVPYKRLAKAQQAKIAAAEAAKEAAKQAKLAQAKASREAIMAQARTMAETMVVKETPEEWRVRKGYVWQATSPSGKVYSEVIRKVTMKEPQEFVEYQALQIAYYKMQFGE